MKDYLKVFKFASKQSIKSSPVLTIVLVVIIFLNAQLPFLGYKISADIINSLIDYAKNPSSGMETLFKLALLWALIESVMSLVSRLNSYLNTIWRYKTQINSEKMYIDQASNLDLGRIESKDFQNLRQRALRRQMWPLTEIFQYFLYIVRPVSIIITSSFIIGLLDWRIYLIAIVSIVPQIIIERKYGKRNFGIWSSNGGEDQRKYYEYRSYISNIDRLPEVKRFGSLNYFKEKTFAIFKDTTEKLEKNEGERFKKYTGVEIINIISFIAIIFILLTHITDGRILIGAFLFYSQTIDRFSSAVSDLFVGVAYQEENVALAKDIIEYFKVKPLIQTHDAIKFPIKNPDIGPEIVFDNVVFNYPDTDKVILDGISFTIKSGERVGLIGINGAGKSTIVKLILRMYDPTSGKITVGGIDLKHIKPEDWWVHLSTLMQDYNKYTSLTLKESVMVSNFDRERKLNKKRFLASLKKSGADDFVKKWKNKYDSMLGKEFDGESLSKGQAQKLALARAFYKEASVMILDEPTAAIDTESEIEIFEELEKIPRTVSILYISHDMATIKKADRIMLIEDGKIVENGDHNHLMKKKGHYARIYNAQLQNLTKSTS
jgi:ATP-binding cassette subfamily B protein